MGLFDSKWVVTYNYSEGIFSSTKRGKIVVEAFTEYDAKDTAKKLLAANYSYVKIIEAHKSSGRAEERKTNSIPSSTINRHNNISTSDYKEREERRQAEKEQQQRTFRDWYAALSPDEKRKYDENKKKERERTKKCIIFAIVAVILVIVLVAIFSQIPKWIGRTQFNNSTNGKIYHYLTYNAKGLGLNSYQLNYSYKNENLTMNITYSESGYGNGYGTKPFSEGGSKLYVASITWTGDRDADYDKCECWVAFNWDDLSAGQYELCAQVIYAENTIFCHYNQISNESCPKITSNNIWYSYGTWTLGEDVSEATECGRNGCQAIIYCLNELYKDVFSRNLW